MLHYKVTHTVKNKNKPELCPPQVTSCMVCMLFRRSARNIQRDQKNIKTADVISDLNQDKLPVTHPAVDDNDQVIMPTLKTYNACLVAAQYKFIM